MTAGEVLAWVGAIGLSVVIAAVAISVVVSLVRTLRKGKP